MSKHTKKRTVTSKPNAIAGILTSIVGKAIGHLLFDLWKEYGPASLLRGLLVA